MNSKNLFIIFLAFLALYLAGNFPEYFAITAFILSFLISYQLEYRKLLHEQKFYFGERKVGLTDLAIRFICTVSAFLRAALAGAAALFVFPIYNTICETKSYVWIINISKCNQTTGFDMQFIDRYTIVFLMLIMFSVTYLIMMKLRKEIGKYHERWAYFKLPLILGLAYSLLYVLLTFTPLLSGQGEDPMKEATSLLSSDIKTVKDALHLVNQFDQLNSAIVTQTVYFSTDKVLGSIAAVILTFLAKIILSANLLVGFVVATFATLMARLDNGNLAPDDEPILTEERMPKPTLVKRLLYPAEAFNYL